LEILHGKMIDIKLNGVNYRNMIYLDSSPIYLICQEADGTIRLFNHRRVNQIICKIMDNNIRVEESPENLSNNEECIDRYDESSGGFIPEQQSEEFKEGEINYDEEFSLPGNLGVRESPQNVRR